MNDNNKDNCYWWSPAVGKEGRRCSSLAGRMSDWRVILTNDYDDDNNDVEWWRCLQLFLVVYLFTYPCHPCIECISVTSVSFPSPHTLSLHPPCSTITYSLFHLFYSPCLVFESFSPLHNIRSSPFWQSSFWTPTGVVWELLGRISFCVCLTWWCSLWIETILALLRASCYRVRTLPRPLLRIGCFPSLSNPVRAA